MKYLVIIGIVIIVILAILCSKIVIKNKENYYNYRYVFTYWTGEKYKLIDTLHEIMYKMSKKGKGYKFVLLNDKNCKEYVDLPKNFAKLSPNHQSDVLRVKLIKKYGGIWLDADTIVLDKLDSLFDIINSNKSGFFVLENNKHLCDGVFGSKPNTKILRKWDEEITKILKKYDNNLNNIGWTAIMDILEKNRNLIDNDYYILKGLDNIYPVNWNNAVSEYVNKPYDNYKNIVRSYQPLLILVNSVYKEIENKGLQDNMPLKYFIDLANNN
jgi:mannosyltransferase OCH1-like enzyme